ncbi:hypothetical protein D3C84_720510 [compost metagenome]
MRAQRQCTGVGGRHLGHTIASHGHQGRPKAEQQRKFLMCTRGRVGQMLDQFQRRAEVTHRIEMGGMLESLLPGTLQVFHGLRNIATELVVMGQFAAVIRDAGGEQCLDGLRRALVQRATPFGE